MKSYKYGELTTKIVSIFENHIGFENAITREELFSKINNVKFNKNSMEHFKRWKNILSTIGLLRKTSVCFIQSNKYGNIPAKYFTPKRFNESADYAIRLAKPASSMIKTIQYSQESVFNEDYRKEWLK